jgi:hypothetical protein
MILLQRSRTVSPDGLCTAHIARDARIAAIVTLIGTTLVLVLVLVLS